jgi:hypothetical protein
MMLSPLAGWILEKALLNTCSAKSESILHFIRVHERFLLTLGLG